MAVRVWFKTGSKYNPGPNVIQLGLCPFNPKYVGPGKTVVFIVEGQDLVLQVPIEEIGWRDERKRKV